jgi:hypothetical protein
MPITEEILEAFLKCKTKSYLHFKHAVGVQSEFNDWQQRLRERCKQTGWERLRSCVKADQCYVGTPPLQALEDCRYRSIIDYAAALPDIYSRIHALELHRSARDTRCPMFRFASSQVKSSKPLTGFCCRSMLSQSREPLARHCASAELSMVRITQ